MLEYVTVTCDPGWKFVKMTDGHHCWTRMPDGKPWGFAAFECQKIEVIILIIFLDKFNYNNFNYICYANKT